MATAKQLFQVLLLFLVNLIPASTRPDRSLNFGVVSDDGAAATPDPFKEDLERQRIIDISLAVAAALLCLLVIAWFYIRLRGLEKGWRGEVQSAVKSRFESLEQDVLSLGNEELLELSSEASSLPVTGAMDRLCAFQQNIMTSESDESLEGTSGSDIDEVEEWDSSSLSSPSLSSSSSGRS